MGVLGYNGFSANAHVDWSCNYPDGLLVAVALDLIIVSVKEYFDSECCEWYNGYAQLYHLWKIHILKFTLPKLHCQSIYL